MSVRKAALALILMALCAPPVWAAGDSLTVARDLYAQASYEDALAMLDRLREPEGAPLEQQTIEQFRALCLLALGRSADAQRAIEIVVAAEPSFHPSETEVSPRVRSAFSDVRRRMLPTIVQQKYTLAKAAFDRKDFVVAGRGFTQVVDMFSDPDLGQAAAQPPLSDLRTLAIGFRDLSVSASPPPPPVTLTPELLPEVAPPAVRPASKVPPVPRVYSTDDVNVAPPSVLRQPMPMLSARALTARQGALALIVDETGSVESATMLLSLGLTNDRAIIAAARLWKYMPATLDGVPVKFRRIVQFNLESGK